MKNGSDSDMSQAFFIKVYIRKVGVRCAFEVPICKVGVI